MQNIKLLQTIYNFQAGIGLLFTIFGTFLVSVMSTDAPNHSGMSVFLSALFSFVISFTITIGLPIAAHKEIENFYKKRKFIFNIIDVVIMLFIFFPIALLQLYLIFNISKNTSILNNKNKDKSILKCKNSNTLHETEDLDEYAEKRLKEIDESLKQYNKSL